MDDDPNKRCTTSVFALRVTKGGKVNLKNSSNVEEVF